MCETIAIESNYCELQKKMRIGCVNKVKFELFVEVIFIPRYSRQHCSELWWNADDLQLSTISAQKEFTTLVNKYPLMTVEEAKRVLY
jgi:hypothetical protein